MYLCKYVCIYVCMYLCMWYVFGCMYACMYVWVCMMYVCIYVCMYAYMYVCCIYCPLQQYIHPHRKHTCCYFFMHLSFIRDIPFSRTQLLHHAIKIHAAFLCTRMD